MSITYIEDKSFRNQDFKTQPLEKANYENCSFTGCDFSNSNLRDVKFIETEFVDCNLSNANLTNAAFQEVSFKDSKLLGVHFEHCNAFGFETTFENCRLNDSSFYQMKLGKKALFSSCQLQGVDFTETDLSTVKINTCDLLSAIFENTNLEKADLRGSSNSEIDPEKNRLKGAKFSMPEVLGLLTKYGISVE